MKCPEEGNPREGRRVRREKARGEINRAESRKGTEEAGEALFRFLVDYEELVYGGKEAGQEALEGTAKEQRRLLELLKKKRRLAWLYCRIRKFIF